MARDSNLLVLDEPTNDLDVETLDLLEEIIADPIREIKDAARRAGRELVEKGELSTEVLDAVAKDYLPKEAFLKGSNDFWDRCIKAGKFLAL